MKKRERFGLTGRRTMRYDSVTWQKGGNHFAPQKTRGTVKKGKDPPQTNGREKNGKAQVPQ